MRRLRRGERVSFSKGREIRRKEHPGRPTALEELLNLGVRATPVTVIDGEVIVGFDRGKIERMLEID